VIISPSLNVPQAKFLALPNKYRALIAGFGTGKTWAGCAALCQHVWQHPRVNSAYYAPTYPHIRDIFYPTIDEVAVDWGLGIKIKIADHEIDYYRGSKYLSTTICRSMDKPDGIIGYKSGHALVDEFDVLPLEKAIQVHRKVYNIPNLKNGVDFVTTPEGFKATYKLFVEDLAKNPALAENYGRVHASTYDNRANLPPGYIESLEEAYPDELIKAYLNGQFTNLTSGTVYRSYDKERHRSCETVRPDDVLLCGMDFNIDHMSVSIYVIRDRAYHLVDEIVDGYNTPTTAKMLIDRYPDNKIIIYPDSSGKNRTRLGGVSESDIGILRDEFGLECRYKAQNPRVRDRVNSVNKAFEDGRLFVNDQKAPVSSDCLLQQVYDNNGEPDKKSGKDHQNDATGYPIAYELPIVKPVHGITIKSNYGA